jgi:hypothetical protein
MYRKTTTVEEYFDASIPMTPSTISARGPVNKSMLSAMRPIIRVDVPLMIRLLEYARESAYSDSELHEMVERMSELCEYNAVLEMDDFDDIVIPEEPVMPEGTIVTMSSSTNP